MLLHTQRKRQKEKKKRHPWWHISYISVFKNIVKSILKCRAVPNTTSFIGDIKFYCKLSVSVHFSLDLSKLFLQLLFCLHFLQTSDKDFEIQVWYRISYQHISCILSVFSVCHRTQLVYIGVSLHFFLLIGDNFTWPSYLTYHESAWVFIVSSPTVTGSLTV